MEPWQNDPIATPQAGGEAWKNDPIASPPKVPDMAGVQNAAKQNLADNDNKETTESTEPKPPQTEQQRLDTAAGIPVQNVLNGTAKPSDINAKTRGQYVTALKNGSASSMPDFMQSMLHSVAPIVVGGIQRTEHPVDWAGQIGEAYTSMVKGGAALLAYPFLPDKLKQDLMGTGVFGPPLTPYKNEQDSTILERANRGLELEQATVGRGMGALYAPVASLLSPTISPIIESTSGAAEQSGASREIAQMIPKAIGAAMDVAGGFGLVHGAGQLGVVRESVGKKLGKDLAAVTPQDIDQIIAQGSKDIAPADKDFKSVSAVTGIPESALHTTFVETSKTPEDVFNAAQKNPDIIPAIEQGKAAEVWPESVEKREVPSEKLSVIPDASSRSFSIVDAEGDHVHGGFDSAEEARHYIEDEKFKAEERAAIEEEGKTSVDIATEKTAAGEQTIIPGAEKISDKELAERKMAEPLKGGSEPVGGMFGDEHKQQDMFQRAEMSQESPIVEATPTAKPKPNVIPPSTIGKPTSLRTFLSNNGAKFNENNELVSIKKNGERIKGEAALEYAHEIAKENDYLPKDQPNEPAQPISDLQNALTENEGREHYRDQDQDRAAKYKESDAYRKNLDEEAHRAGIDTTLKEGESNKKWVDRIRKELSEFYKSELGSGMTPRAIIGNVITAAEKFTGKLTGGLFEKLGEAYTRTFQPELMGPLAKRADAFLAKYKAAGQEAEHAFYTQFKDLIRSWGKKSSDERMQWINDHETGRWNEDDDPDHAQFQALLDATFKAEKESIGADAEKGYKENYLPLQFANEEGVRKFFSSDAMVKKYGSDWFTKARSFDLIQDAVRAGFKLKTDNPGQMLVSRLLAGDNMIRTMDLLHDMEGSGVATRATSFSVDKRIAKMQNHIAEVDAKYKEAFEKANPPAQTRAEGIQPKSSKLIQLYEKRLTDSKAKLDALNAEKAANKLTPEQMKELKGGFRVIGPDSKAWNIHQEAGPLWKNAMEMKGLWENQGITGDAYRAYMQGKAIWTQVKLGLSLFHPVHVAMINLASGIANVADHLIQGGKFSDLANPESSIKGLARTLTLQDHPAVRAWNTAPEARTPEQHQMVQRMVEGGFKPTMSARDTVHFKDNFDKAINGIGLNNLRLLGTAISLPGVIMKPFFEHWIPGMKSEVYLKRTEEALVRDPSLAQDAGKRGEVFRQIAKDTDRTYGEMNNHVQFWNKNVRDSFNAAFISGGWKLAQIYNARGLLAPGKIAYDFAKTGEFSKSDITYNMLHAYAYTGLTLALGGAINAMLGNPIGTAKDTVWDIVKNLVAPQTGEKNPDGTPIRLNQPAFAKEAYNLAHEINTKGILAGAGSFAYHSTLGPTILELPPIAAILGTRDFTGKKIIDDPTDLHQWMNAGWNSINPISLSNYEKAEEKHSEVGKVAGVLGFPAGAAYLNQTPFEQKIIAKYDELHPSDLNAYQAKLKTDLKSSIASHDTENQTAIEKRMKEESMTEHQIALAKKTYTKPFAESAWKELSAPDQRRLIESASEEEKKKFKVKSQ